MLWLLLCRMLGHHAYLNGSHHCYFNRILCDLVKVWDLWVINWSQDARKRLDCLHSGLLCRETTTYKAYHCFGTRRRFKFYRFPSAGKSHLQKQLAPMCLWSPWIRQIIDRTQVLDSRAESFHYKQRHRLYAQSQRPAQSKHYNRWMVCWRRNITNLRKNIPSECEGNDFHGRVSRLLDSGCDLQQ